MFFFGKFTEIFVLVFILVISVVYLPKLDFRFGSDLRLDSKVIDPRESGFDASKFSYEDYATYKELVFVIAQILPRGTKREDVISFLMQYFPPNAPYVEVEPYSVGSSKAKSALMFEYSDIYFHQCFLRKGGFRTSLQATFDENDELLELFFMTGCNLEVVTP
jgi:hypothetical protein